MSALGLDYETLDKLNPRLVMTSVSNFGQTGPYRDFRGSDLIYQGLGGAMYGTGTSDRAPLKKAANVTQYQTGVMAAVATMVAFYGAEIRGYGDHVDVSGIRTDLTSIDRSASMLTAYQYSGRVYPRVESGRRLSQCKDGYIGMVVTPEPLAFRRMATMIGLTPEEVEEWGKTEVLANPQKQAEFTEKFMEPWLLEHTKGEIVEAAQAAGMMSTPLHTPGEVLSDLHYQERGFWVEIDHPTTGKLTYPGAPFRLAEGGWQVRRAAPLLGQHNEEVYGKLGYSQDDLVQLSQAGVI